MARFRKSPIILNPNTSNLVMFEANISNIVKECKPKYLVISCGCAKHDGTKIFKTVLHTCMSKACPICKDSLTDRRAAAVKARFDIYKHSLNEQKGHFYMCYTDFTIPENLRQNYTTPKQWQALRKKIWAILRDNFGALFAVEATHPLSEKQPEVFHPHLNFLWTPKPGRKHFINVELLNKLFRDALDYRGKVNCYHNYTDAPNRIKHWIKYVVRVFPEYSQWSGFLRWYGEYPRESKPLPRLCPCCGKPYKAVGYIDEQTMIDYDEHGFAMGRAPPWERPEAINFFNKITSKFEG